MNGMRQRFLLVVALLANPPGGLASRPGFVRRIESQAAPPQGTKSAAPNQPLAAKALSEPEELQQAIDRAGNDRAALVRNLEDFLKNYPESRQRPQIYRALVEA